MVGLRGNAYEVDYAAARSITPIMVCYNGRPQFSFMTTFVDSIIAVLYADSEPK